MLIFVALATLKTKMAKNLIKTIQNTAFQEQLWQKGSKIVLGVSGGPDSVCLLGVMAKIAPKYDLELLIAHVNYGLRGKDSDKDEKFVRELGEELGVKIEVLNLASKRGTTALDQNDQKRSDLQRSMPSENELREIRYAFFEEIRRKNAFNFVAVAHNLDDQVETFLMRVIRGAGLQGLSAMKFKSGNLIRPLLGISRSELLEYLEKTDRTYRTDRTNQESIFFRNKVRNKLIPYLEKNFNPNIKQTIFNSTVSIADDFSLVQKITDRVYRTNKAERTNRGFSVKKLLSLHPALQRRILQKLILERKSDLKDIESAHIEEVLKALRSTKSKHQIVVFKGLKLTRKGDRVIIS